MGMQLAATEQAFKMSTPVKKVSELLMINQDSKKLPKFEVQIETKVDTKA